MASGEQELFDAETVTSGGGTAESSTINVQGRETMGVELNGDADASDIDVISRANAIPGNELGRHDVESSQDFTVDSNNCRAYEFKVNGFAEVAIKLVNNGGSNSDFDGDAMII